jgi:hypothetical protein
VASKLSGSSKLSQARLASSGSSWRSWEASPNHLHRWAEVAGRRLMRQTCYIATAGRRAGVRNATVFAPAACSSSLQQHTPVAKFVEGVNCKVSCCPRLCGAAAWARHFTAPRGGAGGQHSQGVGGVRHVLIPACGSWWQQAQQAGVSLSVRH